MRKITAMLLPGLMLVSVSGEGADFSLGLQGGSYGTAYKTRHADYWVLPYIGYDGETWYIDGTEAGYNIVKNDSHLLRAKVYYYTTEYRSRDGRNRAMRSLSSRHSTMMAGLSYQYTTPWGAFSTTVGGDTLDNSNGMTINAAWIAMKQWGGFTLVPEVGVDWSNAQNTRYYYGISHQESARSGLKAWRPHDSYVPYLQLAMNYAWTPRWNTWGEITGRFYPSTIRNSPMVNKNGVVELTIGASYTF
ncbi:MipA/OmpV family protein [Enterobacteriaceae bacterium BIT-l23]|uniref:MipA/OmpV family protein n=1 Tax=Jejubacter calystegiae TaxID=2579935 RepID=A0A4P8YHJ3_9ENTR|nr:MipA/OmpV family protein [Jejubacter calystegiae]NUU64551.1 MipA/OmpV family protein [Enterobacteriaceae bacterium BIT-l23]QCT20060.1 MipA/OmpV family protein [Jejubacter calystegiae]